MKVHAVATGAPERAVFDAGAKLVAGVDEVGRGCLAGPVAVGAVVVDVSCLTSSPVGLADSKLLSAPARRELVEPIQAWATAAAVGWASPAEIDAVGIMVVSNRCHTPDQ